MRFCYPLLLLVVVLSVSADVILAAISSMHIKSSETSSFLSISNPSESGAKRLLRTDEKNKNRASNNEERVSTAGALTQFITTRGTQADEIVNTAKSYNIMGPKPEKPTLLDKVWFRYYIKWKGLTPDEAAKNLSLYGLRRSYNKIKKTDYEKEKLHKFYEELKNDLIKLTEFKKELGIKLH